MIDYKGKHNMGPCHFAVRIAGLVFDINTIYPSAFYYCKDFLTEENPIISLSVTKEEIQREIEKGEVFYYTFTEYGIGEERRQVLKREINESVIENIILYRKIIEASIQFGLFFLHGAVIAVKGKAFVFTAPSGTGKTTHILKWIKEVEGSYIVNGDKPLIKITKSNAIACGTPWCGSESYGSNTMVPINSIILMERSDDNHIEEITFSQAVYPLINQIYIPDNKEQAEMELRLISQLNRKVRFFKFWFNNFKDDCFETAYNALIGQKHE